MSRAAAVTLLLALFAPAFTANLQPDDFITGLREAMGDFSFEKGYNLRFSGDDLLVLKAGPDDLPHADGILEDYGVWLTANTQLVIYVKPNLKADLEHFIGVATKRGIPVKRIPKPGSDDQLVAFGPGGKQTDLAVAFCLKNTPVLPPGR